MAGCVSQHWVWVGCGIAFGMVGSNRRRHPMSGGGVSVGRILDGQYAAAVVSAHTAAEGRSIALSRNEAGAAMVVVAVIKGVLVLVVVVVVVVASDAVLHAMRVAASRILKVPLHDSRRGCSWKITVVEGIAVANVGVKVAVAVAVAAEIVAVATVVHVHVYVRVAGTLLLLLLLLHLWVCWCCNRPNPLEGGEGSCYCRCCCCCCCARSCCNRSCCSCLCLFGPAAALGGQAAVLRDVGVLHRRKT
mmetsp:Transcript_67377/g.146661  ORF Transcript_67377/g.146661 Transcript_67377/m.146661 type:complete len:247 (-) Transcript_67377:174-914(-)